MLGLILRRLVSVLPLLLIVSFAVFSLTLMIPGDPAVTLAGDNPTEERIEQIRTNLGLDRPIVEQYGSWIGRAAQGDLGTSIFTGQSVSDQISRRLPITISLTFGALVVAIILGVPAGMVAAARRGSWVDRAVTVMASTGVAVPSFIVAIFLLLIFSIRLSWFPAVGFTHFTDSPFGWAKSILLPSLALGSTATAVVARQLRSAMVDILEQDYTRTARAKGLNRMTVITKHVLKNALIPVVTVLGLQVANLMGGTVIIEAIFGMPGLGSYAISGVNSRDLPVIQGVVVVSVLVVLFVNLIVDILYGFLNPKVRAS